MTDPRPTFTYQSTAQIRAEQQADIDRVRTRGARTDWTLILLLTCALIIGALAVLT